MGTKNISAAAAAGAAAAVVVVAVDVTDAARRGPAELVRDEEHVARTVAAAAAVACGERVRTEAHGEFVTVEQRSVVVVAVASIAADAVRGVAAAVAGERAERAHSTAQPLDTGERGPGVGPVFSV